MAEKSEQIDSIHPLLRPVQWNEDGGNHRLPLGITDVVGARAQFSLVGDQFIKASEEIDAFELDSVRAVKKLADIIYTASENIRRLGFCPNEVFKIICDSNDSKFCANAEEIREAQAHFKKLGIKVVSCQQDNALVVFKSERDQTVAGTFYQKDKILKPPCYYEAEPALADYLLGLMEDS